MAKVVSYIRVSTNNQAVNGESLEVQAKRIEQYCEFSGLGCVDEQYIERGVSGSKPLIDRPEGSRLLKDTEEGTIIVATKLDRMFRSASDALNVIEQLQERGVSLYLLDLNGNVMENGISKMFLTIAAAFAEAERARICERVTEVKRSQRQQGKFLGGVRSRFGYQVDENGYEVEDPDEQRVIGQIIEKREGGWTYSKIHGYLKEQGASISLASVNNIYRRYQKEQCLSA